MGLPVTVYKSTDIGAPQLDGSVGAWLNVIQKCLVDGYGSKIGLGWTRAFHDPATGRVVYRNKVSDGGSGGVVRFSSNDDDLTTINTKLLITQCAKNASDVNSLFHAIPSLGRGVYSSGIAWQIIGTTRGFYITQHYTANASMNTSSNPQQWTLFIGDVESYHANDAGVFTMVTGNGVTADSVATSYNFSLGNSGDVFAMLYDTDGFDNKTQYRYSSSLPWVYNNPNATTSNINITEDNHTIVFTDVVLAHASPTLLDRNGSMFLISKIAPQCRAKLPGIYLANIGGYFSNTSYPIERTFEGVMYQRMRGYWLAVNLWVNLEEWY
tara:strand:- start:421 stop:1395 length:975 start_codon:yes stop_codon:yes gene_type:complete